MPKVSPAKGAIAAVTKAATTAATTAAAAAKKATKAKSQHVKPITTYKQDPFDLRLIGALYAPFGGDNVHQGIRRGFMRWDPNVDPPSGYSKKDPAVVKFLFNPSTISTSYQIATGQAQAALNYGTSSAGMGGLLLPLQQQTSFSIMFDRTYELNDPTSSQSIKNFGVDVDVAALRQYTGMYAGIYGDGTNSNANFIPFGSSNTQQSTSGTAPKDPNQVNAFTQPLGNLAQGIMQVTLGFVYFSGPTSTAVGGKGYGITYYGYVDSWSVEYTHFTQNMIPSRCVVDVSFTFLPPPLKAPDSQGAGVIAASQGQNLTLAQLAGAPPPNGPLPTPNGQPVNISGR